MTNIDDGKFGLSRLVSPTHSSPPFFPGLSCHVFTFCPYDLFSAILMWYLCICTTSTQLSQCPSSIHTFKTFVSGFNCSSHPPFHSAAFPTVDAWILYGAGTSTNIVN